MMVEISRRGLGVGVCALWAGAAWAAGDALAAIEARHGGRLGVFAADTGSGRVLAHRADERFLLCSTFKGVLAAMVLARVDAGQDSLAAMVPYGRQDLISHAPVTAAHVGAGALPVGVLTEAILSVSDNTAANLLLARVGGPAALTRFARGMGDTVTRFDRYELSAGDPSGDKDTTTPRAIVGTAQRMLLGDVLRPASRAQLERWMVACAVGLGRLRGGLPTAWVVGDRTGTGHTQCNDYAIARPPGRAPIVMAAYYDGPGLDDEGREAVLRAVGVAIGAWAG
jgi:beta-lactamase class A